MRAPRPENHAEGGKGEPKSGGLLGPPLRESHLSLSPLVDWVQTWRQLLNPHSLSGFLPVRERLLSLLLLGRNDKNSNDVFEEKRQEGLFSFFMMPSAASRPSWMAQIRR